MITHNNLKSNLKKTAIFSASALALAVASASHAYEFEVGEVTANIGGYTKLDMIYNVNEDLGDGLDVGSVNTGDAEDDEVEGSTRFHARQTRFWLGTSAEVAGSELKTHIEADFFSGNPDSGFTQTVSNSTQLRLRHGYGSWRGILAGQTWSNFMPLVALPPTLDFNGPAGYIFNRQAQLRYTTGGFSVAIENPETSLAGTSDDNDPLPDLTAKYKGTAGPLAYSLSGVVTQLETDDGDNDESETGYGVMFAATATVGGGVKIGGNLGYNDGANRYIFNSSAPFQNGYVDAGGNIETVSQLDAMGFVDVPLSQQLSATVAVGYSGGDADDEADAQAAGFKDSTFTTHANLRFKPTERLMYGVEYQYAAVDEYDGTDGDANRVQLSAMYTF